MSDQNTDEFEQLRNGILQQLKRNDKGNVANSIENSLLILEKDPLFQGAVRKNLLTDCPELNGTVPWRQDRGMMTDRDLPFIRLHFEQYYGIISDKRLPDALEIAAARNAFHPIREYLLGLEWDSIPRVRFALNHFLGAEVNDFNEECLRVFMYGAAERVFRPGCKFELMLCLTGGQGAGKTSFFRYLALKDEWFSDDLRRLDDENVYRRLQGHWIIEMSEMIAAGSARSVEEIKAFLSRQKDTYKIPYDRFPADRPRQCVFAGTTNKQLFLPLDRSGNRRFLPVSVRPEQAQTHVLKDDRASRAYFDQLWAEIMTQYKTGEYSLCLSGESERQLRREQRRFIQDDTRAGQIIDFMEHYPGDRVCSRLLYREALEHSYEDPGRADTAEICDIVHNAISNGDLSGWRAFESSRRFERYGKQRGWERIQPEKRNGEDGTGT